MAISKMTDAMRAEFEVAFRAKFGFGAADVGLLKDESAAMIMGAALWAWEASREALVVTLPGYGHPDCDEHADWHHTRNGTIDACARMIEAQGLKVAP